MYDQVTATLIKSTPALEGLDREELADQLSAAFAEIVATRLRLRAQMDVDDNDLITLTSNLRRLAFTNEALVSVAPNREDRAAAAFVAATAHQLCFDAKRLGAPEKPPSFLSAQSVSADISAMLLFLVAEATADACELARHVQWTTDNLIERALILALRALAQGRLKAIRESSLPDRESVQCESTTDTAASALYRTILEGVRALAEMILDGDSEVAAEHEPISIFKRVQSLSIASWNAADGDWLSDTIGTFAGPYHLASLLIAIAGDLSASAVVAVAPPSGIDPAKWRANLSRIAETRPYLWRNHRNAIAQHYLESGHSAAVGFPTGAGKSILAELKILVALLSDRKVLFLAPTHALVDQTTQSLRRSFPTSSVQRERFDELGFQSEGADLPEIFVMTPEACLMQLSVEASVFDDVGLFIFDECHLLHPGGKLNDRRAVDAMLCVLNIGLWLPECDLLLLSAMMKNTDEIAAWIEAMTERPCLALSLAWKPTRQLRGSVVYEQNDIDALNQELTVAKDKSTTKGVPASAKKVVGARPLGLFSLKQTWATRKRDDYALLSLLDDRPLLGIGKSKQGAWYLTPNAGEVSSALAAAAAMDGVKALVFFQTIKNAVSASKKVSKRLGEAAISLREEEKKWLDTAILELGSVKHLYVSVKQDKLTEHASVHHGLLLPEERRLCESIYKRSDGIRVLTATSTLAQGMNLPSELVILAEDSRFNELKNEREVLEAQELLNAAGRAGRAGQNANGVVVVVPGKVVGIDFEERTIGSHWTTLQAIFGQSDQCLKIDDPLAALLDRVHANIDETGEFDQYIIARLASRGNTDDSVETLTRMISASFAGFRARRGDDQQWLNSRIGAAIQHHQSQAPESENELAERQVAAAMGMPIDVVTCLTSALIEHPPSGAASVSVWRQWFFSWLEANPILLEKIFRRESLNDLFGKQLEKLEHVGDRAAYSLPYLKQLVQLWMAGKPLCKLETALGTDPDKLKNCERARKFAIRIVPEVSFLFGLPSLIQQRRAATGDDETLIPPALLQLGRCARLGLNKHEMVALDDLIRAARFSRRQLHQHFVTIVPFLKPAPLDETWEQTVVRVEAASLAELSHRTWEGL